MFANVDCSIKMVSLLLHRDMGHVCPGDGLIYAGWLGPNQVQGQRVWVHRRKIHPKVWST